MSVIEHRACDRIRRERRGVRRGKFIPRAAQDRYNKISNCLFKNPPATKPKIGNKLAECTSISVFTPVWHGLGTHGGGWGKKQQDKRDKSGALHKGTVRVRASHSWARPAPRSEFFYWVGRAANRPYQQTPTTHRSPRFVLKRHFAWGGE